MITRTTLASSLIFSSMLLAQAPAPSTPSAAAPEVQETKAEDLCTLEGQVTAVGSGTPVKKAQLTLMAMPEGIQNLHANTIRTYVAESGPDGNFALSGIEPGSYRLVARKNGFVSATYGDKGANSPGTMIRLSKGARFPEANMHLRQQGVIVGKIIDEGREPVEGVEVQLLRKVFVNGQNQLLPNASGKTNDLGEYRIFGIEPAKYYVKTQANSFHFTSGHTKGAEANQAFAPVYYPGTPDTASAIQVDVASGVEMRGVDFQLRKIKTATIKGKITGVSSSAALPQILVLQPKSSFDFGFVMANIARDKATFELNGVTPGSYILTADTMDDGHPLSVRIPLEISGEDIDKLTVTLQKGVDLPGSFVVDGEAPKLEGVRVQLSEKQQRLVFFGTAGGGSGQAGEDGRFVIDGLKPAIYVIHCSTLPEDTYVKSVSLGGQTYAPDNVDLSQGVAGEIQVNLARDAGTVEGDVSSDGDKKHVAGTVVILAPSIEKRNEPSLFRTTTVDQNGHFSVKTVPPGTYKLFALEGTENLNPEDPEALRPYEGSGVELEVEAKGKYNKALKVIPVAE